MKQDDYECLELEQNNMQMILKFPKKTENEENIKTEVKEILSSILQESKETLISSAFPYSKNNGK